MSEIKKFPVFGNMEIDNMDNDAALKNCIKFKEISDEIKMQMDLLKVRMQKLLTDNKEVKFTNDFGEVALIHQERKTFQQPVAKKFLTEEQIAQCYKMSQVDFVKVISAVAKENQVY